MEEDMVIKISLDEWPVYESSIITELLGFSDKIELNTGSS